MTITSPTSPAALARVGTLPAAAGGPPAFPDGLPLMRPTLRDLPVLQRRLAEILSSGQLTNGATVRLLEDRVAERLGVDHVIAVASCTSGLALVLQALGARGDVVLPSFTFSASAHAVVWAGGTPRFTDVVEDNLCLDPAAARASLPGAVAMTATHLYGTPARPEQLEQAAAHAGVPLVFDAAHGLGSMRQGVPIGRFGVAEVFSLSPTKVMVAGEGGLVATRNAELASALRLGRDYGNPGDYNCRFPGLNARMSELHAAVAAHSLASLDDNIARRNELADVFWAALADVPGLRRPTVDEGDLSTYKDLTVVVDRAEFGLSAPQLARALGLDGVDTRRYYHPPIHRQDAYRDLARRDLPVTDHLAASVVSVPLWSHMSDEQILGVAAAIAGIQANAEAVVAGLEQEPA